MLQAYVHAKIVNVTIYTNLLAIHSQVTVLINNFLRFPVLRWNFYSRIFYGGIFIMFSRI